MSDVVRYRIYTEHLAPTLVSRHFDGFNLFTGVGYYKGKREHTSIAEIIGTSADADKVQTLAREIREQYRQAEVWITAETVSLTRVTIDAVKVGFE